MSSLDFINHLFSKDRGSIKQIDSYLLLEKINYGGMADIYKAQDKDTGKIYAVKILLPAAAERTKRLHDILREDRLEGSSSVYFDHPAIVHIYKTGKHRESYYVVMELIEGDTLQKSLVNKIPLSYCEKIEFFLQVAQGLQYLHNKGIIHNDINPKNIMITNDRKVKIIDFGIAVSAGSRIHRSTGIRSGTPAYMAPEQIRSLQVDFRTDIYNLGVTFYEVFSGERPFGGKDPEDKMREHLNIDPPDIREKIPGIDESLAALIMKCIQRNPDLRVQDMSEVCFVLSEVLMKIKQEPI